VPVAFFFEGLPVGARTEIAARAFASDFISTSDGLALARAFMRIRNVKLRRAIVALVEQLAAEVDGAAA